MLLAGERLFFCQKSTAISQNQYLRTLQTWILHAVCEVASINVVHLQVKPCDPHLSALEVRFSRRGAIQIYVYVYVYLYLYHCLH